MVCVFFRFPFAPENLVSRDRFGPPVPRQPPYSILFSTLRLNLVLTHGIFFEVALRNMSFFLVRVMLCHRP